MKNIQRTFTYFFLLIAVSTTIAAQDSKDTEGWTSFEFDVRASSHLFVSLSQHFRYHDDISSIDNYFTQLALSYEIFDDFYVAAGTRFLQKKDDKGNQQGWEPYFRYQLDAHYKHKVGKLSFLYRLRYQQKDAVGVSESEGDITNAFLRFRFGVGYKLKPIKTVFKLQTELFNQSQKGNPDNGFNRNRFTLSAARNFKGLGKVTIFYRLQNEFDQVNAKDKAIIGLKYKYEIDLR
jgi:hypothetical protein